MTELDRILMTVISATSLGLGGYIVKLHRERTKADKTHREELLEIAEYHAKEMRELTEKYAADIKDMVIASTTAMVKMTNALENANVINGRLLDRLK